MGSAVGVVFDALDLGGDTVFRALEVDNSVVVLVPATDVPGGDATGIVAATGLGLLFQQGRIGLAFVQILAGDLDLVAAPG